MAAFFAAALAFARSLAMVCSGAWTTTYPAVSKPARPARPAICRNSRGRRPEAAPRGVEAGPPGAARDLKDPARPQARRAAAVDLRQPGEEHGRDRDVDADAERVGPADPPQQPALRQLLDPPPVAGQH